MADLIALNNNVVKNKVINIKDKLVILDRDVAEIYGVETKEINQAVKNNPKKFPEDFIIEVDDSTKNELVKNFDRFNSLKHSTVNPKAFTEQGLYMLATILKSKQATEATIQIIRTFAQLREIQTTLMTASNSNNQKEQTLLLGKSSQMLTNLLKNDLEIDKVNAETTVELNLGFLKLSQKTSWFTRKKDSKNK